MADLKPVISSIRYSSTVFRRRPKAGELRETKRHGKQVRLPRLARDHRGRVIGLDCTGGRPNYDWVSYDEARQRGYEHLIPKEAPHAD